MTRSIARQISRRPHEAFRVVIKSTESVVALAAEQSTHALTTRRQPRCATGVIVVNMQDPAFGRGSAADRASSALAGKESFIILGGQAVFGERFSAPTSRIVLGSLACIEFVGVRAAAFAFKLGVAFPTVTVSRGSRSATAPRAQIIASTWAHQRKSIGPCGRVVRRAIPACSISIGAAVNGAPPSCVRSGHAAYCIHATRQVAVQWAEKLGGGE